MNETRDEHSSRLTENLTYKSKMDRRKNIVDDGYPEKASYAPTPNSILSCPARSSICWVYKLFTPPMPDASSTNGERAGRGGGGIIDAFALPFPLSFLAMLGAVFIGASTRSSLGRAGDGAGGASASCSRSSTTADLPFALSCAKSLSFGFEGALVLVGSGAGADEAAAAALALENDNVLFLGMSGTGGPPPLFAYLDALDPGAGVIDLLPQLLLLLPPFSLSFSSSACACASVWLFTLPLQSRQLPLRLALPTLPVSPPASVPTLPLCA